MVKLRIQKLKVEHVVRYLEEVILRIKQHAKRWHVILVLMRQRRMKCQGRTIHRVAVGPSPLMNCTTTQIPPPQHPVPPPNPVFVYLHRNVHESMEMNQTLQVTVSVVLKDVLLVLGSIVLNL